MTTFRCGHPREGNSIHTGPRDAGNSTCALCARIRRICYVVLRDQDRINAGNPLRAPRARNFA